MAARKMMAAKGEGVYWQKTGDAESLERLPVDRVGPYSYRQQAEATDRKTLGDRI
jgi:hypothetical protein